ncbi:hypothetical protein CHS0354_027019 [Potamilus streckersoni]|uniref:Uncharacterized protein n=1 Tax=Potamilus streckersoni TaxID=2493646 RepID=A0AAE0T1J9_9BIVA|nr:hypothetical protein CHS0354_027019 [Potamilus streckersoni]
MGLAASRQEAFWEACGFGHIEKVRKFLQDGDVDVNWVSYTHDSCPIHVASQGKPEIVKMLIDAKCNVCARDIRGNMAIHHAAMKGHADIIKMLVDAGSEINCQDKNGWTPLHNAAYWCQVEAVKVLLECGSDVSIQNKDQRTALHETARSQERRDDELGEIARLLIIAGSDINAKSSDLGDADLTGLIYAAYHNHPDVALAFIEGGCELDAVGTTMWTALHWAADRGNDEIVYILLEAGADPTVKGMRGELAADRAKSSEVNKLLLNAINMHHEMAAINIPAKSNSSHSLQNKSFSKSSSSSPVKSSMDMLVNKSTNSSSVDKSVRKSESSHSFQDKLVNKSASNSSIQYGISITKSGSNVSVTSDPLISLKSDSSFSLQSDKNEVKSAEVVEAAPQENDTDDSYQLSTTETKVEGKKDIDDDSKILDPQAKQVDEKDNTSVFAEPKVDIHPEKVGEKNSVNDDSKKSLDTKVEEEDYNIVDTRNRALVDPKANLSQDEDPPHEMKISDWKQSDNVETESDIDTQSFCKFGISQ